MSAHRLLVIDDEPEFSALVQTVGERLGYAVSVASRAEDFKASYTAAPPQVIVLDIVMPEVDGIELTRWLAENGCTARVILITGRNPDYAAAAKALAEASSAMLVRILTKPLKLAELRAALAPADPT